MIQHSDYSAWKIARISAFWDRPGLTYEKWREAILRGNNADNRMLVQSLLHMSDEHLINLIGLQAFIAHYPDWRKLITNDSQRAATKKCILDSMWSLHVCGTVFMKNPSHEWFTLTKKQKETFQCIADFGYESIYKVAKRMKRNYKRVHDDVKRLITLGFVQSREKIVNGKRTFIVGL